MTSPGASLPMVGHLVPIRFSARDIFARSAAVFVLIPVSAHNAPPVELVKNHLTPAEARVAPGLALGQTVDFGIVDLNDFGTGDFNGDSRTDIVWHDTDGTVAISTATNGGGFNGVILGTIGASWQAGEVSDFNHDGFADILWRDASAANALWTSYGAGGPGSSAFSSIDPAWAILKG